MKRDKPLGEVEAEHPGHRCQRMRGVAVGKRLSAAIVCAFMINGCINQIRMGIRPNIALLETSLRLQVSTPAEVQAVLGAPHGQGRTMLPIDRKPRTLWSYYYEVGDMQDSRRIFLFVYFDQERYDGYMWFSSLPEDAVQ